MTYNMNLESKRQELSARLVEREIFYCVSSLVSTLSALAQNVSYEVQRNEGISWEEDILPLLESTDYEEAVREYVDNADVSDLESLVENDGYWQEFLEEKIYPVLGKPGKVPSNLADKLCIECHMEVQGCGYEDFSDPQREAEVKEAVEDYDKDSVYCGAEHDEEFSKCRCDCCMSSLAGQRFTYENPDEMEEQSIDDWLDADKERDTKFREIVFEFLQENSDMEELCREYSVDTDDFRNEVYMHFIVSDWLAARLKEHGETVGELCGLTIWARTCFGQSTVLDRVIQDIAIELWHEEWDQYQLTCKQEEPCPPTK